LSWSVVLAQDAQDYANRGQYRHDGMLLAALQQGENLATGFSVEHAMQVWYDELHDCDWTNGCASSINGKEVGHFTNLIWKSTTKLGCAVGTVSSLSSPAQFQGKPFYVCRYADTMPNSGTFCDDVKKVGGGDADCPSCRDAVPFCDSFYCTGGYTWQGNGVLAGQSIAATCPRTCGTCSDLTTTTAPALTTDAEKFLHEHNQYRCMHDVQPLTWSQDLADQAEAWASNCCQNDLVHSASYDLTPIQGENLAGGHTLKGAIKAWYDEINCCQWPGCRLVNTSIAGCEGTHVGHFTAMIWSSSTLVGCARNPTGWQGRPLIVCRYAENAPNYGYSGTDYYAANVPEASSDESECFSTA